MCLHETCVDAISTPLLASRALPQRAVVYTHSLHGLAIHASICRRRAAISDAFDLSQKREGEYHQESAVKEEHEAAKFDA